MIRSDAVLLLIGDVGVAGQDVLGGLPEPGQEPGDLCGAVEKITGGGETEVRDGFLERRSKGLVQLGSVRDQDGMAAGAKVAMIQKTASRWSPRSMRVWLPSMASSRHLSARSSSNPSRIVYVRN